MVICYELHPWFGGRINGSGRMFCIISLELEALAFLRQGAALCGGVACVGKIRPTLPFPNPIITDDRTLDRLRKKLLSALRFTDEGPDAVPRGRISRVFPRRSSGSAICV